MWAEKTEAVVYTSDRSQNNFFLTGAEDGTVSMYSLETNELESMPVRCTLPIRDIALSPDGRWAAVASEYGLPSPIF